MPIAVQRLEVEGLHGRVTYRIPIIDNRLVLIGENGTGKSTLVNVLYFFLTRQWVRLLDYKFDSVSVTINNVPLRVTHEQVVNYCERRPERTHRRFPRHIRDQLESLALQYGSVENVPRGELRRISSMLELPISFLVDTLGDFFGDELPLLNHPMQKIVERLGELMSERVLYLPTYRRIEQELNAIFRGGGSDMKQMVERAAAFRHGPFHVELVAFGMEDVSASIDKKMASVKDSLREELNALTGSYLRDVIQGKHNSVSYSSVEEIDDKTLEAIFRRLDEEILPASEKATLRNIMSRIHHDKTISYKDQVVAHFLTKLRDVHAKQEKKEIEIREFVRVCNEYLSGKHLYYDDLGFSIRVFEGASASRDVGGSPPSAELSSTAKQILELSALSSGEKQIVSLFSHIYLSDTSEYLVIIDEPELSLSVPWQKRFLPDIMKTNKCKGIVAVTHSPFIYDNEFEPSSHAITEFREPKA